MTAAGFGTAIDHGVKPQVLRRTFDRCRADRIEGSQQLGASKTLMHCKKVGVALPPAREN